MSAVMSDREKVVELCELTHHNWQETYYGVKCINCGLFYPDGCAPWDEDRNDDDPTVYRTCPGCGGEFWDGGTSCTCLFDDNSPDDIVLPDEEKES